MRLIDAYSFDRALANHEFTAALNEAASNDRAFEAIPMLYSTQSFRDVMKYRPTIDAVPVEWLREFDLYYAGISGGSPYFRELMAAWQKEQETQEDDR